MGRVYPTGGSATVMVGANLLLSAAIGAVVVKQLLLSVVECEISYSTVVVALVAGSAATRRLEQALLPGNVSGELNQRLVRGMRQLADDLVDVSQEAATTGSRRALWYLDQSEGLQSVRQALADLEALGFGTARW